jgi:cytochrome c oxidase subunit 2
MKRHAPFVAAAMVLLSCAPAGAQEAAVARGAQVYAAQGCYGCHQIGKAGTPIGPDLSAIGAKYSRSYLTRWLRDPQSVRPAAHMPRLELAAEDIEALAAYLASPK